MFNSTVSVAIARRIKHTNFEMYAFIYSLVKQTQNVTANQQHFKFAFPLSKGCAAKHAPTYLNG
jgi:hypothetical protein